MKAPLKVLDIFNAAKVQPQAPDLEEAVLGSAMLDQDGLHTASDLLRPDAFYVEAHRIIFEAIVSLANNSKPVDILTVTEQLRSTGDLDLVGGAYFVTMLTNRISSAANTEYHCRIILQKYYQRELIKACTGIVNDAYSDTDIFDLLNQADLSIQAIQTNALSGSNMRGIIDLLSEARQDLTRREKLAREGKVAGIRTGLSLLNKATGGWQKNNLIILASRPGMGKTSLMLHFAKEAAKAGEPVCIYSLEMSGVSLANRLILSECGIDLDNFKSGRMSPRDWSEFGRATDALAKLPIYVDDNPSVSIQYIRNHSKMMAKRKKCSMILADYLQLADVSVGKDKSREQEISQASRGCKLIAKELDIPFILLSQLNRSCEGRADKKPMLSDLRDSGAIEQDADIVLFVYRPAYYNIADKTGNVPHGMGELLIAKNRDGALMEIGFKHNESLTSIYDFNGQDNDLED